MASRADGACAARSMMPAQGRSVTPNLPPVDDEATVPLSNLFKPGFDPATVGAATRPAGRSIVVTSDDRRYRFESISAAPFIPNYFLVNVQFCVVPTLGTSLLAIGTVYWFVWARVLPAFGHHIQHEIIQMLDGSERVKYKRGSSPRSG
ncbi:2f0a2b46-f095-4ad3-9825-3de6e10148ce [Thermothielavioides terrestris]|uniref:2f0a2b46-f095-4ad3-9825-3de6e10148ce n=1 Tax=Thermothielavioides terrestris TaxID=2587410 RepID=A0A3S4APG2_9PEZI|nr:2f0a2b46-f095-4ad3-9825-3de6e10148ce [Thermothielavioides terrestris]